MGVSSPQSRATAKYRSKAVKQVNVPFYPADQMTYDFLNLQQNKAGFIKDLITREIASKKDSIPSLEMDSFLSFCEASSCKQDVSGWPDAFGHAMRKWVINDDSSKGRKPLRVLSLFSGAGGLDIGFLDAGFQIVEAVEIEESFCKTLEANCQGTKVTCCDIRNFSGSHLHDVDFIIGGPPCQTFSAAGRRANGVLGTSDARGVLFREYVRLLESLKPQGFLFENVYGITGAQGGEPWKQICEAFSEVGYKLFWRLLDAADYGVPQHRERLIIIGLKAGTFSFPAPLLGPDSPQKSPFYNAAKAIESVSNNPDEVPPPIGGRYGHLIPDIPPGLNYSFFTEELGNPTPIFSWRSKFSDFMYKADPSVPVRTIKAQGGQYTGPFHWDNRHFSLKEYKRLQTFPDTYTITGSRAKAIQQIGNSVPPQFARILALAVRDQVFSRPIPFMLQTLSPEDQLGFRKRKRQLTEEYRHKAEKALRGKQKLSDNKCSSYHSRIYVNPESFATVVATPLSGNDVRNVAYQIGNSLSICLSNTDRSTTCHTMEMEILPSSEWSLPYSSILLKVPERDYWGLTIAWKALEDYLASNSLKADLVQLAGYYQYEPNITCCLKGEDDGFMPTIRQVANGNATRAIMTSSDFSKALKIDNSQLMKAANTLKKLGYEVRNWNTNPQIPEEHWLLPYEFPTFTPMSIQRTKSL